MCRKITSHWQPLFSKKKWWRWPHFPTKLEAVASFSYKIGGGGLIFLQNWRRRPHFPTKLAAVGNGKDLAKLLAAVLTWSGYWYLQPRGYNFNQKYHIANICGMIYFGQIHHKIHFKYLV